MSLHRVDIRQHAPDPVANHPVWKLDEIESIRRFYSCDCKSVRHSGWICEHVLAAMALQKAIDLDDVLSVIPARRAPGRPRKTRGGLNRDDNDTRFFNPDNLIKILANSPGHVFHWSVMKEFAVKKRGQIVQEHVAGRITGWQKNRGRFAWSLRFTNDKIQELECQDLAKLLSYSYAMGMNVDGLPE